MNKDQPTRRSFIYLLIGGGLLAAGYPLINALSQSSGRKSRQAFAPTPSNSLGPFYKKGAPQTEKLRGPSDCGQPITVSGRIINEGGQTLAGANLEVFHADDSGNYDMEGFHFRGQVMAGANGEYRFETIMPGGYGGRPRHIHYVISAPGHRQLITQLYFANDPFFSGNPDGNYSRDSLVKRDLIRPVTVGGQDTSQQSAVVFDICLVKS